MRRFALLLLILSAAATRSSAQCASGEVSFYMIIRTDAWPYETYWQLSQGVQACVGDFVAEGSNLNVGCDAIPSDNSPEGYPGEATVTTPVYCLTEGSNYTLQFIDTYGDGGLTFEVYQNGLLTYVWTGEGSGSQWNFIAGVSDLPPYDSPCGAVEVEENGAPVIMNNTAAVATSQEVRPPALDCSVYGNWCENAVTNSVWAKFVPQSTGVYELTTCNEGNGIDTQLAVWKATDCSDYSTFTLVTANDDAMGGCNNGDFFSSTAYVRCLDAGTEYLIQVDGWTGATGTIVLSVQSVSAAVTLEANVSDVPCPVDKGQSGTGNILPYLTNAGSDFSASWIGPNGFTSESQALIDVPAGSYTLTATDGCGVSYEETFQINIPQFWSLALEAVRPTCDGSIDGSLAVVVSGGTGPYNYVWSGNAESNFPEISGIGVGSYTFTVTDDNDCSYSQSYEVTASNSFMVDLGDDMTICLNQTIELEAPLGSQYQWQDGSTASSQTVNAAALGVGIYQYQVTVSTEEGCVAFDDIEITVDDCTGVEELTGEAGASIKKVNVYPQPVEGESWVTWEGTSENIELHVYDTMGKLVHRTQAAHTQRWLWPSFLAGGCYVLQLSSGTQQVSVRVVVQ